MACLTRVCLCLRRFMAYSVEVAIDLVSLQLIVVLERELRAYGLWQTRDMRVHPPPPCSSIFQGWVYP